MSAAIFSRARLAPALRWMPGIPGTRAITLRRALLGLSVLIGSLLALMFLALAILPRTGAYATYLVLSDSMQPAIPSGSVVIVRPADPETLKVGDVISYTSNIAPYPTLTHRIVSVTRGDDGKIAFKTKGDFNLVEDSWEVHYANQAGLVAFSVPMLGYVLATSSTTAARVLLGVLLAGLLALFWLKLVWAKPNRRAAVMRAVPVLRQFEARRGPYADRAFSALRLAILGWLAIELLSRARRRDR